jgi:hypothetical protein
MDFHRINDQGKIWIQRVDDVTLIGHTAADEGRMVYSKSNEKIYIATDTEWLVLATKYAVIESGSKMLFGSYPLPPGWNITAYNDVIVSITNSSGSIGSLDGSWVITGFGSEGSHDHGGYVESANVTVWSEWTGSITTAATTHKHSLLSDGNHTHTFDGTWRPTNVKFCEATLQ